jgi:hypothetical protein
LFNSTVVPTGYSGFPRTPPALHKKTSTYIAGVCTLFGMVTRRLAASLVNLAWNLAYVFERCRSMSEFTPYQFVPVKGDNFILSVLQQQYPIMDELSNFFPNLVAPRDSVRNWIAYLDKKYPEQQRMFGPPVNLDTNDAKRLARDVHSWFTEIMNAYFKQETVLVKEETIDTLFPEQLLVKLDEMTRADLNDGITCILHLLPTPAAMILLRVAENIVRKYYAKTTGKTSDKVLWGEMLKELEQGQQIRKPLLGYLEYLKDKRNEAEHPDKRFNQEEAERLLIQVKEFLEEVRPVL